MATNQLRRLIDEHRRAFLDTMVFIYVLEDHPLLADPAAIVFNAVEEGRLQGITSTLTLTELLTAPAQIDDENAFLDYKLYLCDFPNLTIHDVDVDVASRAARIRGKTGLPTPDAIQLATAYVARVDAIITNDRRWRGYTGTTPLILLGDHIGDAPTQPHSR